MVGEEVRNMTLHFMGNDEEPISFPAFNFKGSRYEFP